MGSCSSVAHEVPGGDLRLPATGLKFSINQLRALNAYAESLYQEDQKGRMTTETEMAVESLVQRMVDGAGQRDPRFKCCHLIALHRGKKMRSRSLEYLVTLDSLQALNSGEDCRLQDGPVGYGKIRLTGRDAEKWEEFLTPSGYLCRSVLKILDCLRDKIIERWVELIARCANARGGGGSRVLCARAEQHARPFQYCYLERVNQPQSIQDRRLAIVEGAAWVMVRVGVGEAEAKLMLAARVEGCSAAAYTTRIPLSHPLALLHYTSAQGGYFAAAVGPPTSMVCAERASTWQLWHPSLEAHLDAHCSQYSPVAKIAGALNALVDRMRDGFYEGTLRLLSRYAVSCALRRRLDRCAAYPQSSARSVLSSHVSHHLLLVLDSLYALCDKGGIAGYVYPVERGSVVRRAARDQGWKDDANCIKNCLMELYLIVGEDIPSSPSESLEAALFFRWEGLNKEWKSAAGPAPIYNTKQLRYLWRVARELVACKNMVVVENHSIFRANLIQATSLHEAEVEDLIHILAIMLDQARDQYLNNTQRLYGEFDREMTAYRLTKWNKLKNYYDASSAFLIDAVRRDPDLRKQDLTVDVTVTKQILKWLYKGAKEDKKYLAPVLKPYLDAVFATSLENACFMDEFVAKKCHYEFEGLKDFCIGVHNENMDPCLGLLDAAKKMSWAKSMVDYVERYRHIDFRLVFPTGDGMGDSYPVKLPSRREQDASRTLTLSRRDKAEAKLRLARRCVLGAFQTALLGEQPSKSKHIFRHGSEEILHSLKNGSYWRSDTKPDIIPSTSIQDLDTLRKSQRRSRSTRPTTSYGFPEISITNQSDTKTLRRKYHTLRSLVFTEPMESVKEMRQKPRSAGSTVRSRVLSRPSLLETLDFINSVKNTLCDDSGQSDTEDSAWTLEDDYLVGQMAPLNLLAANSGGQMSYWALGEIVPALLCSGRFSILQELCSWVGGASEGALFALHRLARAARSKSSDRAPSCWSFPEDVTLLAPQRYRSRPLDYMSGDEAPQPPPLPRTSSREKMIKRSLPELLPTPSKRIEELEQNLNYLELVNSRLNLTQNQKPLYDSYTGIINPIYDKIPKDKFRVKRSRSLGRSYSNRRLGLDLTKYNVTLGRRYGKKTNEIATAINGMTGQTGL